MTDEGFKDPEEFIETWIDTFTTDYSYRNPTYGLGVLHVIMGRCLINQRIQKRGTEVSPRISMFYLQGASSGKSSAYPMIYEVVEELGIDIQSPDETTDAAMIGTVERTTDDHGNETWEVDEGILHDVEVLHYDEASVLLDPKDYQQNTMTYFQKALNPIGSEQNKITKELAHGEEIVVRPTCSLLLTSYMPKEIVETVLNTGFMQRLLVLPRELTIEDRMEQAEEDIKALGQESNESSLEELILELKRIQRFYTEPKDFDWSRAKPSMIKFKDQMFESIKDTPRAVQEVLESFIPRQIEQMYRLSLHYAAMRRSTKISQQDVRRSYRLVRKSLEMIIAWLEENPELAEDEGGRTSVNERYRNLTDILEDYEPNSDEYYGVSTIMSDLSRVWGLSETSCYRWVNRLEDKGWISVRQHNGMKYIKLEGGG